MIRKLKLGRKIQQITEVRDVVKADGTVEHIIEGIATSEDVDGDNEICDYEPTKALYEAWSEAAFKATTGAGQDPSRGNVRLQHTMAIAGKVAELEFNDSAKRIIASSIPVDEATWLLIKRGFVTGYSQGGSYAYRTCDICGADCGDPGNNKCPKCKKQVVVHYACDPAELSYVDKPCNGAATFTHVKADGSREVIKFIGRSKEVIQPQVVKAKTKRVAGEDLPSSAFAYVGDADRTGTWHYPIKFSSQEKTKTHIRNALSQWEKPDGQKNIPSGQRSQVHARIVAAARRYGISVSSNKSAGVNGMAFKRFYSRESLGIMKSMYGVASLARILMDLKYVKDSSVYEGEAEDDERDFEIAEDIGTCIADLIGVLQAMVAEEGSEMSGKSAADKAASTQGAKSMDINELLKAARHSLKAHFAKKAAHHEAMAEHHKSVQEEHQAMHEHHKAMVGDFDGDEAATHKAHHKAKAAHHKAMAGHHAKAHKSHAAMCENCKAMATAHDGDGEKADIGGDVSKAVTTLLDSLLPEHAVIKGINDKLVVMPKAAEPAVAPAATEPAAAAAAAGAGSAAGDAANKGAGTGTGTDAKKGAGEDVTNEQQELINKQVAKALTDLGFVAEVEPEESEVEKAIGVAMKKFFGDRPIPTAAHGLGGRTLVNRNGQALKAAAEAVPPELADLVAVETGDDE